MSQSLIKTEGHFITHLMAFCTAIRFLTVVPLPWKADRDGDLFPVSIYYFTIVGILVGGISCLTAWVGTVLFNQEVAAFLVVVALSSASGFLHLDGLADSSDGLLSARPKDDALRIMKDSRTGAMGVVVLVLVLLGKFTALSSLNSNLLPLAALVLPVSGRCAILLTMAFTPYARPEGGLGGLFYSNRARKAACIGCCLLFAVGLAVVSLKFALLVLMVTGLIVTLFSRFCRKRIGGVTGDTLGAVCELTETGVALALTMVL